MSDTRIEELDAEECFALLRADVVGRVAVVIDGAPIIFPVNYRLVDTPTGPWIALRTRTGGGIDLIGGSVAFEIDGIDRAHRRGWSVLWRGTLHHLGADAPDVRARFDSAPWILDERDSWLVIDPGIVTGRRLHAASIEWAFHDEGYL